MATMKALHELGAEIDRAVALFGATAEFRQEYRRRMRAIIDACADIPLPQEAARLYEELRGWFKGHSES